MTTTDAAMASKRILVAEDEYFIAKMLADDLEQAGANVFGPVATVAAALAVIAAEPLDGAVLDINLRGEMAYSVMDALIERGIPTVLATGYSAGMLPARYACLPRCDKPVELDKLSNTLFPN